ncbi:hypothetical protein ACMG4P_08190 [Pseudovibrio denitrificans]|uniref:hypothetical protein n=1 Tax=Pseudovibrio denitrificans TaxID=258256 RepID=UPI0039BF4BB5
MSIRGKIVQSVSFIAAIGAIIPVYQFLQSDSYKVVSPILIGSKACGHFDAEGVDAYVEDSYEAPAGIAELTQLDGKIAYFKGITVVHDALEYGVRNSDEDLARFRSYMSCASSYDWTSCSSGMTVAEREAEQCVSLTLNLPDTDINQPENADYYVFNLPMDSSEGFEIDEPSPGIFEFTGAAHIQVDYIEGFTVLSLSPYEVNSNVKTLERFECTKNVADNGLIFGKARCVLGL